MNDFWTYLQTSLSTGNAEVTTATVVVTMLLSVVVGSLIYLVYRFFRFIREHEMHLTSVL